MILTLTVQEPLTGIVPPVGDPKVSVVATAAGAQVGDPPQVVVAEGVAATCRPEGSESVNVTPLRITRGLELASVKVKVEVPLTAMGFGENTLVIVGGLGTTHPVNVTSSRYMSEPETELPAL